jgi:hypothetical protein
MANSTFFPPWNVMNLEDVFHKKIPLWQNFAQKKTLHVIWSQWTIPKFDDSTKFEELTFTNFS